MRQLVPTLILVWLIVGCAVTPTTISPPQNYPTPSINSVTVPPVIPLDREFIAFCGFSGPDKYSDIYVARGNGQQSVRFNNTIWPKNDNGCWKFGDDEYTVAGLEWSLEGDSIFSVVGDFMSSHVLRVALENDLQFGKAEWLWPIQHGFQDPQQINLASNGTAFAFVALARSETPTPILQWHHVFVSTIDATRSYPITNISENIEPLFEPVWSPDNGQIAFAKIRPSNGIGIASSDGSKIIWLTAETQSEFPKRPDSLQLPLSSVAPVWFRDSSHLLFLVSLHGVQASALYRVKRDGTMLVQLKSENVYTPAISPDGTRLAYATYEDEDNRGRGMIVIADLNAGNPQTIVSMQRSANRKILLRDLTWSPDGTRLAFSANPKGNMDIFVVNADGTDLQDITGWAGDEIAPRWRPRH